MRHKRHGGATAATHRLAAAEAYTACTVRHHPAYDLEDPAAQPAQARFAIGRKY
jgi:hypothetical protein